MKTITYDETKWQLVPKKITSEMIDVMCQQLGFSGAAVSSAYYEALAASPTPPQQPRQESEIAADALAWQPIETAPKDSFSRLYRIHGFCVQGFIDATGALMVQSEISPHWRMARGKPTHWMPLPEAQKREAGK